MQGLKPEQAMAFDSREFARVVLLGIAAGEATDAKTPAADAPQADGSVEVHRLPDNPYSKATFALRKHYAGNDRAFASAVLRFRAFMNLLARGVLNPWVRRREGERMAIHPAALDVASQMKISKNGRFPPRKFHAAVAEVVQVHYPHLQDWGGGGDPTS